MPETPAPETTEIADFWREVERSYDIEPRQFFEKEAKPMGYTSAVAMAVHHMWKRDVKEHGETVIQAARRMAKEMTEDLKAENTRLRTALEACVEHICDSDCDDGCSWVAQAIAALASPEHQP